MQQRSRHARLHVVAGLLAALACLMAAVAVFAGDASAAVRVHEGAGATASDAQLEAARVARYWTVARMRSAQPLDEVTAGSGGQPAQDPPASEHGGTASASYANVPDTTVPPYSVNGRLFVRQGDAQGYCSATAINSPTRQLVLTAGHCVNSGPKYPGASGIWSQSLEFVPAYSDGVAPFGVFVARRDAVFAPKPWLKRGNPNFDLGAFLTLPNANGENVADAVGGGATIVTDQDRHQQFQTFGYPGSSKRMSTCNSPYVGDDPFTYGFGGPPTISIRCHWIPGASGGGWLIAEGTAIDGLTTYGLRTDRVHTFGPYFSSANVGALVAGL